MDKKSNRSYNKQGGEQKNIIITIIINKIRKDIQNYLLFIINVFEHVL